MDEPMISSMSDAEAWEALEHTTFGRLAIAAGGMVDIFPINITTFRNGLLFRTAAGTKLTAVAIGNPVAFETDGINVEHGWSVVVHGTATELVHPRDITEAETAPLVPWVPTRKPSFVYIEPTSITGKVFQFGPEPDDYV